MRWAINGQEIPGPDKVVYLERGATIRLDGVAERQGFPSMEWQYATLNAEDMSLLLVLWNSVRNINPNVVWYTQYDGWQSGNFQMHQPVIGRRRNYLYDSVAVRFSPKYRGVEVAPDNTVIAADGSMSRFQVPIMAPEPIIARASVYSPSIGLPTNTIAPATVQTVTRGDDPTIV